MNLKNRLESKPVMETLNGQEPESAAFSRSNVNKNVLFAVQSNFFGSKSAVKKDSSTVIYIWSNAVLALASKRSVDAK
ncbi:hypothetical protein GGTG_13271 [Gaeumannomyces tritici R3-111a-1]|uniref:Uncharacterized protein n=1 Tax=Gaeumannomyces tritici (strain R3-111a-1) TaxID=644352 RepID=J3PIE3_GAET3|nr:hypothetical protein GGTG_13271 [Gaeumannomyces tritici R3-111a-1]EJT69162.1 hypothetical protein GGTG_13271 [Gaeumannomyces tritici R3-111a-1]